MKDLSMRMNSLRKRLCPASRKSLSVWILLFTLLYLSFCGRDRAESVVIPDSFSRKDIHAVIAKAKSSHIDPNRVSQNLSYVRATEAALRSLPYSLLFFSKEYYKNRAEWKKGHPIIPGRALFLNKEDPYVVFIPNYDKWEVLNKKEKAKRKKRNKKLKEGERRKVFFAERKKQETLRKLRLAAWKKSKFSVRDFERVLSWLEKNWEKYKELPKVYKKKKAEQKRPDFGLHYVYFAAANGFLRSMDPHCSLIPRQSWQKMLSESEDSSFEGIGALLRGGGTSDVVVETPLPGSPALNAGLRAGDIIRKVDGSDIENMLLSEVVKRIRGPRETTVVLHVERPIELRNLDINIKRGVIKQLAVTDQLLSDKESNPKLTKGLKIGVIQIKSFLYAKRKTNKLVVNAYKELLKKSGLNLDALVLDLRNNPGGYLEEAVKVADLFLPSDKVVVTIKAKNKSRALKTRKSAMIKDIPIVVLINSGSASASEILASALMDHNNALVLGERSFGKATVQSVEKSVSDTFIKITSARYYAPKDYTVQVSGVQPDIKLSNELDDSFPPRFREENMWDHLPHLEKQRPGGKRLRWINKLKSLVGKNTVTQDYIKKHKDDALRPDYMLLRSIAYIHAMRRYPKP